MLSVPPPRTAPQFTRLFAMESTAAWRPGRLIPGACVPSEASAGGQRLDSQDSFESIGHQLATTHAEAQPVL
jgi:hypothetical protein